MNLTRTGIGIGTPEYMAPEQAQGNADPRSDIYALGVIAYEGLAGRVPYRGNTPVDIAIQHMTAPLPPLSPQLVSKLPYAPSRSIFPYLRRDYLQRDG